MKTEVKKFKDLSVEEIHEILRIRSEVFVVEQRCIYQDIDGKDEKAERKSEERRSDNERRRQGGGRGGRGRGNFDPQRAQEMRARWQNASPEERQKMIEGFRQRFGGSGGRWDGGRGR